MDFHINAASVRGIQAYLGQLKTSQRLTHHRANQLIEGSLGTDDKLNFARGVDLRGNYSGRGLLFQRLSDPNFFAYLIPNNSLNPSEALTLEFPFRFPLPLAVGLIFYHEPRKRVAKTPFLFSSVALTLGNFRVDYSPIRRVDQGIRKLAVSIFDNKLVAKLDWQQSATLLDWLNKTVDHLPYRPGDKERLLQSLLRKKIYLVGDLVQKTEEELREFLSESDVKKVKAVIRSIDLELGIPLPGWNKRIQKSSV